MKPIIIRVTDGKMGHDRQSIGLCRALASINKYEIVEISALSFIQALSYYFFSSERISKHSIIIGAGHGTHWTLLAYKLKHKLSSVVIMSPSLPEKWFDIVVAPKHDEPSESDTVLVTRGALNNIDVASIGEKEASVLILIGGESRHVTWDNQVIYEQILSGLNTVPENVPLVLTTSRRTPADFLTNIPSELTQRIYIEPFDATSPDWLLENLAISSNVWVTSDSISMVYEALTAKCVVSILKVPEVRGKTKKNLDYLLEEKRVNVECQFFKEPIIAQSLDEAGRIAALIEQRIGGGRYDDK